MRKRSIRRSQLVTTFGPGAIFDIGEESLIACDTTKWPAAKCQTINLQRLERRVKALGGFKMPPIPAGRFDKNPPLVSYFRFPRWLFCPHCRRMTRWSMDDEINIEKAEELPSCKYCTNQRVGLVPMRFVLVCEEGHLGDVDWHKWAHSSASVSETGQCSQDNPDLRFISRPGVGSGLRSLVVRCNKCQASRDLEQLMNPEQLRKARIFCSGGQPWLPFDRRVRCESRPQVEQRGSSNVYFPSVVSALDIPFSTTSAANDNNNAIKQQPMFAFLKKFFESSSEGRENAAVKQTAQMLAGDLGISVEEVLDVIDPPKKDGDQIAVADEGGYLEKELLAEEWPALKEDHDEENFVNRKEPVDDSDQPSKLLAGLIDRVMLVERLREVRALRGFDRVSPSPDPTPPDLTGTITWLPGIEVFGEGIFIAFNEDAIQRWTSEKSIGLGARLNPMQERKALTTGLAALLPNATPRFVLLHTFAHLLVRQLCFECGYDSASLRERIYSAESGEAGGPMAGLLIYTADADSEGSLGGLVRQGRRDRLASSIQSALRRGSWCSSDPICGELPGQGLGGLNRAACHACTLLAETSCPFHNVLLDRAVVVGRGESGEAVGFFADVLKSLDEQLGGK